MAKKASNKSDNKNIFIGICIAVLVIAVIGIAIFFATRGTGAINDNYFKSDDTKYVITMEGDSMGLSNDSSHTPVKTHQVYKYSGDKITSVVLYLEFADESAAKSALEYFKQQDESASSLSANGKYIVIEMPEEEYSSMTTSQVKQYVELTEKMKNSDTNESEEIKD